MNRRGDQAEPRPPGSFVGRGRELAELHAGLTDVTAGNGHLFLLSGEPGIGKTRLADEFGPEWTARLKELGAARAKWRSQGLSPHEVSRQVREMVLQMGWL